MKKISLFVLALALFMACKNDPSATSGTDTSSTSGTTEAPAMDKQKIAAGKANAVVQNQALNQLITEIDALPATVRNKPEVQTIRTELGDISGKMDMMMKALDVHTDPSTTATDGNLTSRQLPGVEDAISSMDRYGEIIAADQAKIKEMSGN